MIARFNINGILLLNKPKGLSSHTALRKVMHLLHAAKGGHTGSLDPLATGMLPICLGEATKYSRFFLEANKSYEFTLCLGTTTTTGDTAGEIVVQKPVPKLSLAQLSCLCTGFIGDRSQIPPMFSALKHQGRPLYALARKGQTVDRPSRKITLYMLSPLGSACAEGKEWSFKVVCSKGTYIRTLAEEIGEALGCGAHVTRLHRVWSSPFETEKMWSLEQLSLFSAKDLAACLLDIGKVLAPWLPPLGLMPVEATMLLQGKTLPLPKEVTIKSGWVSLWQQQVFIGVGEIKGGWVVPRRLMANNSVK